MSSLDPTSIWTALGLALVIGEMATTSFFLLFIALGCFAAALASSLGYPFEIQGIACAVISVLGVLVLRKPIQTRLLKSIAINADIGKEIQVDQPIAPHTVVTITYQGTSWSATNLDSAPLNKGDRVVIVGIDGNTLLIRKVN